MPHFINEQMIERHPEAGFPHPVRGQIHSLYHVGKSKERLFQHFVVDEAIQSGIASS